MQHSNNSLNFYLDDVKNKNCIEHEPHEFYPNEYAAFYGWPYTFNSCYNIPAYDLQDISEENDSASVSYQVIMLL